MKIVTKTETNAPSVKCILCKRVAYTGQRIVYHASGGNYSWILHMECLSEFLCEEPEFLNVEVGRQQYDLKREALLLQYGVHPAQVPQEPLNTALA